jgi:hypothetical protein
MGVIIAAHPAGLQVEFNILLFGLLALWMAV